MGDTLTSTKASHEVSSEQGHDLEASTTGMSVWEGRALAAQDQLAALAHELGETSIAPSDITLENAVEIEQAIYRAALIRGVRGEDLSQLVYQVQRYSQDVQSAQGYDPSQVEHAAMDIGRTELLPELQSSVVGARHGNVLDVSTVLNSWQTQIDRVTEIAQIYEHSGRGLQRVAAQLERKLASEFREGSGEPNDKPHLEIVKKS